MNQPTRRASYQYFSDKFRLGNSIAKFFLAINLWSNRRLRFLVIAVATVIIQFSIFATPGFSAERVYVNFGPLERFIAIADLKSYVKTGQLPEALRPLGRFLDEEQLEGIRTGLSMSVDIDVVTVSQFLYTQQGEAVLEWLGDMIQTAGRLNGGIAFRGSLILAAADPDGGLNVINVLKHFPTSGIRLNLTPLVGIARTAFREINQTQEVTSQIMAQAPEPMAGISDRTLSSTGPLSWQVRDLTQTTQLPTYLYLPAVQNAPLVVASHGLGGNRETLAYLAEHLASHGFAIAVVEHPGSSDEQLSALLRGTVGEAVDPEDMVRRPTDIQTLLDDLETLAQSDPTIAQALDFERVGVLGHSMGGYTTLALAGATVDFDTLAASCPPEVTQLNLSLLLQCLVPSLPQPLPPLQDERIKAAIAINPLDSAVFGPTGMGNIDIPLMMVSGSADTVTPALAEQIRPFTWLTTPDRYLLFMERGTHFSVVHDTQSSEESMIPAEAIGPDPEIAQDYVRATGLAFLKTYLAEDESYRQYLDPTYAAALSQSEMPVVLTQTVPLEE